MKKVLQLDYGRFMTRGRIIIRYKRRGCKPSRSRRRSRWTKLPIIWPRRNALKYTEESYKIISSKISTITCLIKLRRRRSSIANRLFMGCFRILSKSIRMRIVPSSWMNWKNPKSIWSILRLTIGRSPLILLITRSPKPAGRSFCPCRLAYLKRVGRISPNLPILYKVAILSCKINIQESTFTHCRKKWTT